VAAHHAGRQAPHQALDLRLGAGSFHQAVGAEQLGKHGRAEEVAEAPADDPLLLGLGRQDSKRVEAVHPLSFGLRNGALRVA
jgi:hypothetical protein